MSRQQKLVDAILEDGRKEALKLTKKAQKQSEQILREQEEKEQQFFEEQIENFKKEQEFLMSNQKLSQDLRKNKIVLEAKNVVLQKVFDQTLKNLQNLSAKEQKTFFQNALKEIDCGSEIVVSNEKDKKVVKSLPIFKTKKLKISKDFGNFLGGFVAILKNKEIDFSFESLLLDKFETQKFEIAKDLF